MKVLLVDGKYLDVTGGKRVTPWRVLKQRLEQIGVRSHFYKGYFITHNDGGLYTIWDDDLEPIKIIDRPHKYIDKFMG